ncbi:MAG TPA: tryptophan--tRNA ligase [Polyangia bacterium]|nr:tryptophan--tRNA ligase [Polyangia bacterium]
METVFSGIQPTGTLHIGNYLGAIRNWVAFQDQFRCFYCIVDYHALTADVVDQASLPQRTLDAAIDLLACGIDPQKAVLFVQSQVPEHTELCWIFNTVTPMGELERMTQYKDKAQRQVENINVGLFDYPVLQAADIMLYKATRVPVGQDQVQHLELAREIARKFNAKFGETFPEPQAMLSATPKILGLDGSAKMSKSLNNAVYLRESPDEIWAKLKVAVTDPARVRRTDPGNPDVCNVFSLEKSFCSLPVLQRINRECRSAEIGCIDCKKLLLADLVPQLAPIRERALALAARPDDVRDILAAGAGRAHAAAGATLEEVRRRVGVRS